MSCNEAGLWIERFNARLISPAGSCVCLPGRHFALVVKWRHHSCAPSGHLSWRGEGTCRLPRACACATGRRALSPATHRRRAKSFSFSFSARAESSGRALTVHGIAVCVCARALRWTDKFLHAFVDTQTTSGHTRAELLDHSSQFGAQQTQTNEMRPLERAAYRARTYLRSDRYKSNQIKSKERKGKAGGICADLASERASAIVS